jgi:hypothetical protein
VADRVGLPPTGSISSVALIVTALAPDTVSGGFATVYPGGSVAPDASNVNTSARGDIRANLVVVPLGADGSVSISSERIQHVIVDVVGTFTVAGGDSPVDGLFRTVAPVRPYDERSPGAPPANAELTQPLGSIVTYPVAAVLQNLTITSTGGFGFVSAAPAGLTPPTVSNVNATAPGQTRAALAITRLADDVTGSVTYRTFGESQLIVDVVGFFRR